jgi:hypothetical protein
VWDNSTSCVSAVLAVDPAIWWAGGGGMHQAQSVWVWDRSRWVMSLSAGRC